MELKRVIGAEGDEEASREEVVDGVLLVVQEEGVVREGRHGNADLGKVIQVLQHWSLSGVVEWWCFGGGGSGGLVVEWWWCFGGRVVVVFWW